MDRDAPRVLVVDDDEAFGSMVAEVLRERGYETTPVTDARDALARAGNGEFAATLVDLVMPDMGGIELVERLREASSSTQLVILTGHGGMDWETCAGSQFDPKIVRLLVAELRGHGDPRFIG